MATRFGIAFAKPRGRSSKLFGCGTDFPGFEQVLDGGFVEQYARFSAYLDGIAVVPLDDALDAHAIFEDEYHLGLELDLLLQVEQFSLVVGAMFLVSGRGEVMRGSV